MSSIDVSIPFSASMVALIVEEMRRKSVHGHGHCHVVPLCELEEVDKLLVNLIYSMIHAPAAMTSNSTETPPTHTPRQEVMSRDRNGFYYEGSTQHTTRTLIRVHTLSPRGSVGNLENL